MDSTNHNSAAPTVSAKRPSLFSIFEWLRWRIAERDIERASHQAAIRALRHRIAEVECEVEYQKCLLEETEAERFRLSELCQTMRRTWARRLGRGRGTCEFTRVWIP